MNIFYLSEVGAPTVVLLVMLVFGTIVGSFLNVVVFRLGTGESVGWSRSRCFSCGRILTWWELVPLVSFFVQKGRCRFCGSRISWQYPIVEFITGLVFLLVAWNILGNFSTKGGSAFGGQLISYYPLFELLYFFTIFSLLVAISVYDLRHKIIPNQLVYPFIILAFLSIFGAPTSDSLFSEVGAPKIMAGGGAFLFFASLWFFSKGRWMGFGDAKLALGIGFLLSPWLTVVAGMLSFWIGTLVAVPLVLFQGGGLKTQIPFGPFLAAGAFVSWLVGESILRAYWLLLF